MSKAEMIMKAMVDMHIRWESQPHRDEWDRVSELCGQELAEATKDWTDTEYDDMVTWACDGCMTSDEIARADGRK